MVGMMEIGMGFDLGGLWTWGGIGLGSQVSPWTTSGKAKRHGP